MKLRKSIKVVAIAAFAAIALTNAPAAHAADGAPTPEAPTGSPQAVCAVSGEVQTPVNPTLTVSLSSYEFRSAILECVDVNPANTDYTGSYNVAANGATYGPLQFDPNDQQLKEGNSTVISWSDGALYTGACGAPSTNRGNISTNGPVSGAGYVKFVRGASATLAWGKFCTGDLGAAGGNFQSTLLFTPRPDSTTTGVYDLNGSAVIFGD